METSKIMDDIYSYVKTEENKFQTDEIQVGDNWHWNFRDHIQMIFHLKNGVFYTGENNWLRAFKNILEPILHLSYWTEDLEVKDVQFYTEEENHRVLSFLLKKYHQEVYAKEHDLDTLFDEITESDLDYGGVLVQKSKDMPEVLALNSIAFCDQTDMLGSPVFFKHNFSPDKLRAMSKFGWGEEKNGATISLDDLCNLATFTKDSIGTQNKKNNQVPGKQIEVYVGRGDMPENYLQDDGDSEYYCPQVQIIAYYFDKNNKRQGVTLYRKEDDGTNLKFFTSQKVYGRALGRGLGETLLHPQIWTNFLEIHKMNMLEAGSKIPLYTDDPTYNTKNKIQDMENLEITTIEDGKVIRQVPTVAPANIQLFQSAINEWYDQAQLGGSAFDPIMGKEPPSGTTFRGQERNVAQGKGLHERRVGQRAKFIEEIYRDWIIPDMMKEIVKGKKFLATLTTEDLAWVSEQVATNLANQKIVDMIIAGEEVTAEQYQTYVQQSKQATVKKGGKQLIEILKGEFSDVETKVGVDVANKQKDMVSMVGQLNEVLKTIMANPFMLKAPPIQKIFNTMIESMGLPPIDLSTFDVPPMPARRMVESIDYKDVSNIPGAQEAMLQVGDINVAPQTPVAPQR